MSKDNDHLKLWDAVEKTDPKYTKAFNRGGGFKGTATNATWLAKQATRMFGPCGIGWGVDVVDEALHEGAVMLDNKGEVLGREIIHKVRVKFWYRWGDKQGEITQFGQTTFVGKNKYGPFTDEEAPKKSLTDAMGKCLSLLGFAGDIHLGLWDDHKYVAQREAEAQQAEAQQNNTPPSHPQSPKVALAEAAMRWAGVDKTMMADVVRDCRRVLGLPTTGQLTDEQCAKVLQWIEDREAAGVDFAAAVAQQKEAA